MAAQKPTPTDPEITPDDPKDTDAKAGDGGVNADQAATARVVDVAAEKRKRAEDLEAARAKLLAQLAEVDDAAEKEGLGTNVKPTHLLVLADGNRVESSGAVPTHYSVKDGPAVPVTLAIPLEGLTNA